MFTPITFSFDVLPGVSLFSICQNSRLLPIVSRSSRSYLSSVRRNASCLVLAEHDGAEVNPGTLAAVTAATKISQDVTMLVMGKDATKVANHAARIQGVKSAINSLAS